MPDPAPSALRTRLRSQCERRSSGRQRPGDSAHGRVHLGGGVFHDCQVVDVSTRGVGLIGPLPLAPGTLLRLDLSNPAGPCAYTVWMEVVRCQGPEGGPFHLGARLLSPLAPADMHALRA